MKTDSVLVLGRMLLRHPRKVLTAAILGIAVGLAGWAMAFFIQSVLDRTADLPRVALYASAVALVLVVRGLLVVVRRLFQILFVQGLERELAQQYVRHLLRADLLALNRVPNADLYQRLKGLEHVRNALEDRLLGLVFDVLLVLLAALFVFLRSPALGALALAGAIVPAVVVRFFRSSIQQSFEETQERDSQLMCTSMDALDGMRDLRMLGAEEEMAKRIEERYSEFQAARFKHWRKLSILGTATGLFSSLIHVGILAVGAGLVVSRNLTPGQLMFAYTLSGLMLGPIENFVVSWIFFDNAQVALQRREDVLRMPATPVGSSPWPEDWSLRLEGLDFAYQPGSPVLRGLSLQIPMGSSLAIVGESGAGKTTLLYLLAGLVRPTAGTLKVGGRDLHDLDPAIRNQSVAVVFQAPHLFQGTLEENLRLGHPGVEPETLHHAIAAARADFIREWKAPFDPAKSCYSAGELQRLAIARALARKPRILLLDEATSNLDAVTEEAIWSALSERPADCTLVFVTHRLRSSAGTDCILVLDQGRIAESGTFDQLVAGHGLYHRFWSRQYRSLSLRL